METAAWIFLFIMTVVLHEVSHGVVAYALGDPTAKQEGRLSLNPLRHVDPFWTVILPVILFFSTHGRFAIGMAKPVPVDFSKLHKPKRDMIWVGLAGPAVNIILAFIFSLFWKATGHDLMLYGVYLNLGLALFNLIPIPPLDGSRIMAGLLPGIWARRYLIIERFGFAIIILLYLMGWLFRILLPVIDFFCSRFGVPALSANL